MNFSVLRQNCRIFCSRATLKLRDVQINDCFLLQKWIYDIRGYTCIQFKLLIMNSFIGQSFHSSSRKGEDEVKWKDVGYRYSSQLRVSIYQSIWKIWCNFQVIIYQLLHNLWKTYDIYLQNISICYNCTISLQNCIYC